MDCMLKVIYALFIGIILGWDYIDAWFAKISTGSNIISNKEYNKAYKHCSAIFLFSNINGRWCPPNT